MATIAQPCTFNHAPDQQGMKEGWRFTVLFSICIHTLLVISAGFQGTA
jgi:hypothetical protein